MGCRIQQENKWIRLLWELNCQLNNNRISFADSYIGFCTVKKKWENKWSLKIQFKEQNFKTLSQKNKNKNVWGSLKATMHKYTEESIFKQSTKCILLPTLNNEYRFLLIEIKKYIFLNV